ncbi:DUF721 domain-containing protein [Candidatus Aerophobetes bacterium]|nr:DUF721 domain-containing protein [Candidatus Aerophobetes bacterium]
MMEDSNPPSRVGEILQDLVCRFGMDNKIKQLNILKLWPEVVGETLSKHSQAVSISKGNLFVKVDNSAWLSEFSHFKEKIILKFNERHGEQIVKNIYFQVGSISSYLPGEKKKMGGVRKVRLERKDVEWIDKIAANVKDENLKKVLRRILLKYTRAQKMAKNKR